MYVRLHVLYDFFRIDGQTVHLDERSRRLFGGRVATQEFHAARLKPLNGGVLIGGVGAAGVLGCVLHGGARFTWEKNIADGGLSGLGVVLFHPLTDSVQARRALATVPFVRAASSVGANAFSQDSFLDEFLGENRSCSAMVIRSP